jgi:hypothetical protein
MFDVQCRASGELVLELATIDQVRGFLSDLHPLSDWGGLCSEDVRRLLEMNGYNVFEID